MQKLITTMTLAALAGSAVAGSNITGPFALHIIGKLNKSIDGYAGACHAGAATEGLCYTAGGPVTGDYYSFYYNYTEYEDRESKYYGSIVYNFTYTDSNDQIVTLPSAAEITGHDYATNVQSILFPPGGGYYQAEEPFSADDEGSFYITGYFDDSSANATLPTYNSYPRLYNFHLCFQYTGTYWYHSVAWVTSEPPHNPSCEPIWLSMAPLAT
ncbi:hypothetical protein F5Y18DRAFT_401433 [Xylariaceae sp. FL1019]|nr:hypothetical protein F5Y18DRAFT_401433 [Xylariaceae sp. FL1019]